MKIEHGYFAGLEIPQHEVLIKTNPIGVGSTLNGGPVEVWPLAARRKHFDDRFPFTEGYTLSVVDEASDIRFDDPVTGASLPTRTVTATFQRWHANTGATQTIRSAKCLWVLRDPQSLQGAYAYVESLLLSALGLDYYVQAHVDEGALTGNVFVPRSGLADIQLPVATTDAPPAVLEASAIVTEATAAATSVPGSLYQAAASGLVIDLPEAETQPVQEANEHIDPKWIRKIRVLSDARGITLPRFADLEQAKSYYRSLLSGQGLNGAAQ